MTSSFQGHPAASALVIGNASNALSIGRALAAQGIVVDAMAPADAPAVHSSCWRARHDPPGVGQALSERVAEVIAQDRVPCVLYPTNDVQCMELDLARSDLGPDCVLPWCAGPSGVSELLLKTGLSAVLTAAGLPQLATVRVSRQDSNLDVSLEPLGPAPWLVKPERPMGPFKARVIAPTLEGLELLRNLTSQVACVVQPYMEPRALLSAAGIARSGKMVADPVCYQKLRACPAKTGQGSLMALCSAPAVAALLRQFVHATGWTGAVAIECIENPTGELAIIDATVARFEYCIELMHGNGLPLAPMLHAVAMDAVFDGLGYHRHHHQRIWCDMERDPAALLLWIQGLAGSRRLLPLLPYFRPNDPGPVLATLRPNATRLLRRLRRLLIHG